MDIADQIFRLLPYLFLVLGLFELATVIISRFSGNTGLLRKLAPVVIWWYRFEHDGVDDDEFLRYYFRPFVVIGLVLTALGALFIYCEVRGIMLYQIFG